MEVPREAGLALAAEVYSPHLDLHQRLVVLDTLSAAALQMSTPPSQAKATLRMEVGNQLQPLFSRSPRMSTHPSPARATLKMDNEKLCGPSPLVFLVEVVVKWSSSLLEVIASRAMASFKRND